MSRYDLEHNGASESRDYRATHAPNYYVEAAGDTFEDDLVLLIPNTRGLPAGYVAELSPNE